MRRRHIMPFPAGAKPLGALAASTWTAWAVVAIAAAGWLLRAFPLMQGGAFGYPVDYDEGVYFASSSLLLRGALPYRDFAFVHPPGLLYCLWPAAWLGSVRDPSIGFAAARWLFALIGVASVLLVGRVAMRFAGSACAIAAAVVYATHPLAVSIERGPFLEPVLNLCCLWLAWIWLAEDDRKRWQALAAGTVCGLAISVKLVGAVWLLACVLSTSRQMRRELLAFFAACAISFAVVVGPVSLTAPAEVWRQTISFQLHRPADGTVAILERLAAIFWLNSQLLKSALVVGGLALAASRARNPERRGERFFCVAFISIIAVFLSSSSYWSQYNAHLAVPRIPARRLCGRSAMGGEPVKASAPRACRDCSGAGRLSGRQAGHHDRSDARAGAPLSRNVRSQHDSIRCSCAFFRTLLAHCCRAPACSDRGPSHRRSLRRHVDGRHERGPAIFQRVSGFCRSCVPASDLHRSKGLAICDSRRPRSLAIVGTDATVGPLAISPAVSASRPGWNRCLGAGQMTALRGQARLS